MHVIIFPSVGTRKSDSQPVRSRVVCVLTRSAKLSDYLPLLGTHLQGRREDAWGCRDAVKKLEHQNVERKRQQHLALSSATICRRFLLKNSPPVEVEPADNPGQRPGFRKRGSKFELSHHCSNVSVSPLCLSLPWLLAESSYLRLLAPPRQASPPAAQVRTASQCRSLAATPATRL